MGARKEDEIMAEYLLRGGKMLEKTCRTCGCPLFEFKGKTGCVVCAENAPAAVNTPAKEAAPSAGTGEREEAALQAAGGIGGADELAGDLVFVLRSLCRRAGAEQDPERVQKLMDAIRAGTEALGFLRQV